jgi:uncharacterized protein (DUF4415 family)
VGRMFGAGKTVHPRSSRLLRQHGHGHSMRNLSTPKPTRGRPKAEAPKVPVTLRVDPDVLAAYKASGPGWQTRMNEVLRKGQPKPPVYDRKKTPNRYLSLADFMTDRFGPMAIPVKRMGTKRCKELRERRHTPVRQADFYREGRGSRASGRSSL